MRYTISYTVQHALTTFIKEIALPGLWDYGVTTTNEYYCVYYDYIVDLFARGKIQYIQPSAIKKSNAKHAIVLRNDWEDVVRYVVHKYDTLAGDDEDEEEDDDDDNNDGDSNEEEGQGDGVAQAPNA
jgi:hypothetical protein